MPATAARTTWARYPISPTCTAHTRVLRVTAIPRPGTCLPLTISDASPPNKAALNPTDRRYVCEGTLANGFGGPPNTDAGKATFTYPNDQPSTTLWYHDHTLGLTRLNVYAMGAGFWHIRAPGGGEDGLVSGTLPGPAPTLGEDPNFDGTVRAKIREIPIAIQDKAFNTDGSLFYPANRAFFEGLGDGQGFGQQANIDATLNIPVLPDATSDISPVWNPEAFFNTILANGNTWPKLAVEPERYRFRLLNATNSRFLNLAMFVVNTR